MRYATVFAIFSALILTTLIRLGAKAVLADGTVRYLEKNAGKAASDFGSGLFLTIIVLPGIIALAGIYLGAGISALSRWLAGCIWREPEAA